MSTKLARMLALTGGLLLTIPLVCGGTSDPWPLAFCDTQNTCRSELLGPQVVPEVKWCLELPREFDAWFDGTYGPLVSAGNYVYLAWEDAGSSPEPGNAPCLGKVSANGSLLWTYDTGQLSWHGGSYPLAISPAGYVIVGEVNTILYTVTFEGELNWTCDIGDPIDWWSDWYGFTLDSANNIYATHDWIGMYYTGLVSISGDGQFRWKRDWRNGWYPALLNDQRVCTSTIWWFHRAGITCWNTVDGQEEWAFGGDLRAGKPSPPAILPDFGAVTVYGTRYDQESQSAGPAVYCVNSDGSLRWSFDDFPGAGPVYSSGVAIGPDGTSYVSLRDDEAPNYLLAIKSNGEMWWQKEDPGLSNGVSLDADGNLYCCVGDSLNSYTAGGDPRWTVELPHSPNWHHVVIGERRRLFCLVEDYVRHEYCRLYLVALGEPGDEIPTSSCLSPQYANTTIPVEYEAIAMYGLDHVELWYQFEGGEWVDSALRGDDETGELTFEPPDGDGEYAFAVVAEDIEGNRNPLSDEAQATTIYDTSAPTSSASCEAYSTGSTIQVSYSASDTTSGVASVSLWYRRTDSRNGWIDSGLSEAEPEGVFSFHAARDGVYEFATIARDMASNAESLPEGPDCSAIVDTTAPASSCESPGIVNQYPIEVEYRVTDETSGVASVELWFSYEGGAWTESGIASTSATVTGSFLFSPPAQDDGTYGFATLARDRAGNVEALADDPDDATLVDTVPPASSCSCDEVADGFPIAVSYTAADAGSGVSSVALWYRFESGDWANTGLWAPMSSASFNFRPGQQLEGLYEFATVGEDAAGNVESLPENADCSVNVGSPAPRIEVSPESIDFGEVAVGEQAIEALTVHNAGDAALYVHRISVDGDGFSLDLEGLSLPCIIEPDGQVAFDVTFAPQSASDYSGVVSVQSSDPDSPSVEVNLTGSGTDAGELVLRVFTDHESYDFGDTILLYVSASNTGAEREVDVYLFVCYDYLGPDHIGWYAVRGGWSADVGAWLPGVVLAAGLDAEVLAFELPTPAEPSDIIRAGEYTILIATFEPGTFDWASNLAEATFSLRE